MKMTGDALSWDERPHAFKLKLLAVGRSRHVDRYMASYFASDRRHSVQEVEREIRLLDDDPALKEQTMARRRAATGS